MAEKTLQKLSKGARTWVPESAEQDVNLRARGWKPVAVKADVPVAVKADAPKQNK